MSIYNKAKNEKYIIPLPVKYTDLKKEMGFTCDFENDIVLFGEGFSFGVSVNSDNDFGIAVLNNYSEKDKKVKELCVSEFAVSEESSFEINGIKNGMTREQVEKVLSNYSIIQEYDDSIMYSNQGGSIQYLIFYNGKKNNSKVTNFWVNYYI